MNKILEKLQNNNNKVIAEHQIKNNIDNTKENLVL
jgi:hypothetical protein